MKKCKWINYILAIAMVITIFSQQVQIKRYDSRIKILENENIDLFRLAEQSAGLLLKLAIHQKLLSDIIFELKNNVDKIINLNEEMAKDILFPVLTKIAKIINTLIVNQDLLKEYIIKNVDSKPALYRVMVSTVEIKVGHFGGAGTIIKIDDEYLYILTAKHVMDCEGDIELQLIDFIKDKKIRIKDISRDNVYLHKEVDMALLKVSKPEGNFSYLNIATQKPLIGTKIYTMGHPMSIGYTVQTGIVSNYTKRIFGDNKKEYMMVSAPAFHGNSGGSCFNCKNELVGIVVGVAYSSKETLFSSSEIYLTHMVFVVTVDYIRSFLKELNIETENSN